MNEEWKFEYEQAPFKGKWPYKFDHEPIADGLWHPLNGSSAARYRVLTDTLQFFCPHGDIDSAQLDEIVALLEQSFPLPYEGVIEIFILKTNEGFEMWDYRLVGISGVKFLELTPKSFVGAFRELLRRDEEENETYKRLQ